MVAAYFMSILYGLPLIHSDETHMALILILSMQGREAHLRAASPVSVLHLGRGGNPQTLALSSVHPQIFLQAYGISYVI